METPNLNYIKEISDGDEAFEQELIRVVQLEFPKEKEIYQKNVQKDDKISISEIVHKIKHKFSILGLEESYNIAVEYEENLREGNYKLKADFEKTLDMISLYLTSL